MKNTHVLPTEKPSYLYQIGNDLTLSVVNSIHQHNIGRHIYITSDEEIKEGDWCLDEKENIVKADKDFIFNCSHEFDEYWKKIILTTDQDLIGVQAIDDEFLEWFVKNPSCDKVDVIYEPKNFLDTKNGWEYTIIIPKEEAKQETIVNGKCFKCGNSQYKVRRPFCTDEFCNKDFYKKPKQETLEGLISEYHTIAYGKLIKELTKQETTADYIDRHIVEAMVEVAKQKMYSEEEVLKYVDYYEECYAERPTKKPLKPNEWFEQKFKK